MLNPFRDIEWHPGIAEKRAFAKSIATGLPIVGAILGAVGAMRTGAWPSWTFWLAGIGGALGVLLWLVPRIAGPFYAVWHGGAACVGFVVGNAFAAIVYYLVITPIGLLVRACGRDPMERRFEPGTKSYWKDAEKVDDAERYFRQY